jgi:hypothetical protein
MTYKSKSCLFFKIIKIYFIGRDHNWIYVPKEHAQIILNKEHLTKDGLTRIISLLYNSPVHSHKKSFEHWLGLIEKAPS